MPRRLTAEQARENLLDILELVATGAPLDDSALYAVRDVSITADARVKFAMAAFAQLRVSMLPELFKGIQRVREELGRKYDVAGMTAAELLRLAEHLRMDIDSIYRQGMALVTASGDQFGQQRWTAAALAADDPATKIQVTQLDREARNRLRTLFDLLEQSAAPQLTHEPSDDGNPQPA